MPGQIHINQNDFPSGKSTLAIQITSRIYSERAALYNKAKRTNKADLWAKYKLCKRQTQRAIRSARWSFLKNKLSESLEQKNSKPLWQIKASGWKWCLSFEGKRPAAFRNIKQPILLSFYLRRHHKYT